MITNEKILPLWHVAVMKTHVHLNNVDYDNVNHAAERLLDIFPKLSGADAVELVAALGLTMSNKSVNELERRMKNV